MHYSSIVSISLSLCRIYATLRYPHRRSCFGRAVSWTVDIDVEVFLEFSMIFASAFFKVVKVSFSES